MDKFTVDLKQGPYNLSDTQENWVEETLGKMSVREKVGQIFCLHMMQEDAAEFRDTLKKLDIKPGGFMTRTLKAEQVRSNFELMQEASDIPLLMAANIERGADGVCYEGTIFGTQMQLAATNDTKFAYQAGYYGAVEGAAAGANWNFGPILDIDSNWHNPITNTRVFSSDPNKVHDMTLEYIRGMKEAGMLVCIKHWPGDGQDERDQHMVASTNSMSAEDWMNTYGRVYRDAINAGAETLMSAHIKQPAWSRELRPGIRDEDIMPGSLAKELNQDLLRGKLGFNGMIVTDATSMNGFMQTLPREKLVPGCIAAGCDMFLFTYDLEEDFDFMMGGVEDGTITAERLDDAVRRILGLKAMLNLAEKKANGTLMPPVSELSKIGTPEIHEAARACADNAITLVKDTQNNLPLSPEKTKKVLLYILGDVGGYHDTLRGQGLKFKKLLEDKGFEVTLYGEVTDEWYGKIPLKEFKKKFDLLLYFANIKTSGGDNVARIKWDIPMARNSTRYVNEIPTVFISVDNPYHLMDVPAVKTYINGYTPSDFVIEEMVKKLTGETEFKGVNPVDPTCGLWDAMF